MSSQQENGPRVRWSAEVSPESCHGRETSVMSPNSIVDTRNGSDLNVSDADKRKPQNNFFGILKMGDKNKGNIDALQPNNSRRRRIIAFITTVLSSTLIALITTRFFNLARNGTPLLLGSNPRLKIKPVLKFHKDSDDYLYRFKIVQLSDLHLGESKLTDQRTWDLVDTILMEEAPDLIVLSGDQISVESCPDADRALGLYKEMGEKLSQYKIPWALVFGDTDDDDSRGITREELLRVDQSFDYSLSETTSGSYVFGTSNYLLNIFADNVAAAQIYFFDSGGGSLPQRLEQSQVAWFSQTNQRLPAVAFQHIPTDNFKFQPQKCMGYHDAEEQLNTIDFDPGLVDAMSETARIYFLAAGHNHGNHYCCPFSRWLQVCIGARTGYGGYGAWERGARVYEMSMVAPQEHKLEWKSWVRLESGDMYDQVSRYDLRTEKG